MLLDQLSDLAIVFNANKASGLPNYRSLDYAINLVDRKQPLYSPIYLLGEQELATLREYINNGLALGRLQHSISAAGSLILFMPKKDRELRLYIDYQGLNAITDKNQHALLLVIEMLNRIASAKWFIKLDLANAYYYIQIKKGDEQKIAFRCRYRHYEYVVMPFSLANALVDLLSIYKPLPIQISRLLLYSVYS